MNQYATKGASCLPDEYCSDRKHVNHVASAHFTESSQKANGFMLYNASHGIHKSIMV